MTQPRRLISMKDAAAHLGCSYNTIKRYAADGSIPTVRVGRLIRVDVDALEAMETAAQTGPAPVAERPRPDAPDPDWVAAQVAQFTPEDLRRAAEVLLSIAGSLDNRVGVA